MAFPQDKFNARNTGFVPPGRGKPPQPLPPAPIGRGEGNTGPLPPGGPQAPYIKPGAGPLARAKILQAAGFDQKQIAQHADQWEKDRRARMQGQQKAMGGPMGGPPVRQRRSGPVVGPTPPPMPPPPVAAPAQPVPVAQNPRKPQGPVY